MNPYTSWCMATILADIRQFIVKEGIKGSLVVAVSGGTDSTALLIALSLLREDGVPLVAAHVNHHLRGQDSEDDEAFVRTLCERLGIRLHVADGTLDPARVREHGVEAAAREVRYARLLAIRDSLGASAVATAHQKNDQAETILIRLLTGSGLAGLRGIHPRRDDGVVRPLLDVPRASIDTFLREQGVVAREDRSNDDPRFLRNRVRATLRTLGGVDALAAIAGQARSLWPILERAIDDADRECVEASPLQSRFRSWPVEPWLRGALLQRHIRRLDPDARDFDAVRIAETLLTVSRISVTRHLELLREKDSWVLGKRPPPAEAFEVALLPNESVYVPLLQLTIHLRQPPTEPSTAGRQVIQLPSRAKPLFTVRSRRRGDRFQPLGLPFAKRLKEFLIDRKVGVALRDRLPLLVWNEEIVWIAGVEVSERFRVDGGEGDLYEVWTEVTPPDRGGAEPLPGDLPSRDRE